SEPDIGTLQGLPEAVLVREPQNLPGVAPLARGGNVFAVSVALSPAEAEQRQASGRRVPNWSFVKPEFCRISGARRARFSLRSTHSCIFDALATLGATQRARPPKGFEAQSRKGSRGSRRRLKAAATVKSFSSVAHPNSLWHVQSKKSNRDIRHKEMRFP